MRFADKVGAGAKGLPKRASGQGGESRIAIEGHGHGKPEAGTTVGVVATVEVTKSGILKSP